MAKKKEHIAKRSLKKISHNKLLAGLLALVFVGVGVFLIYRSFAGSIPVFGNDPDYWRPRIAQCESGGNYQATNGTHFGAYQFDKSTWRGAVGPELAAQYPDPRMAPAAVQDMAFNNTFARRGTQPWNASYRCWIRGATVPASVVDDSSASTVAQVVATVAPTPPAKPFGITSGGYNVVINGRATLNDNSLQGLVLQTCIGDQTVTSDAEGRFSFALPVGTGFCLRPSAGVPAGAVLERTANNVEHASDKTFEYQVAGVNCYRQFWCFLNQTYTWDRSRDAGYNFYYTTTPTKQS